MNQQSVDSGVSGVVSHGQKRQESVTQAGLSHRSHDVKLEEYFDPHEVDHGSLYYKMGWSAYKGHIRGMIRGLVVGSALGAVVGGVVALMAAASIITIPLIAGAGVAPVVAMFAGFGGIMAAELMGRLGNAAGNVSGQLAELELRERYPELQEISIDSPQPGFGHHHEVPADRDRNKLFHMRSGFSGALLGGTFGGLLGLGTIGAELSLGIWGPLAAGMPALAPIAIGALYGGSFGINRGKFKSIFNVTDNLLQGKLGGPDSAQLAKDRERYRLQGEAGPSPVITSLQRQEEFYRLQNGYFKKSFEAAFAGNARGLVGGLISGGLLGVTLGGIALGAVALTGITLSPLASALLFPMIVAVTMKKSMNFSTEAFFEASGHSHVHEVHHERLKSLRKGVDLGFDQAEANIVRRRQADPEMTPPDAQKKSFFNPKVALIMGGLGAAVGTGFAPLLGHTAELLAGGAAQAAVHGAAHGASHSLMGLGAAVFGSVGTVFGIGPAITETLHDLGDRIYHGTFFPGTDHPEIKTQGKIPLMSPRSELAEHYSKHLEKEHAVQAALNAPIVQEAVVPQAVTAHMQTEIQAQQQALVHRDRIAATKEGKQKPLQDILERGQRSLAEQVQEQPALATEAGMGGR